MQRSPAPFARRLASTWTRSKSRRLLRPRPVDRRAQSSASSASSASTSSAITATPASSLSPNSSSATAAAAAAAEAEGPSWFRTNALRLAAFGTALVGGVGTTQSYKYDFPEGSRAWVDDVDWDNAPYTRAPRWWVGYWGTQAYDPWDGAEPRGIGVVGGAVSLLVTLGNGSRYAIKSDALMDRDDVRAVCVSLGAPEEGHAGSVADVNVLDEESALDPTLDLKFWQDPVGELRRRGIGGVGGVGASASAGVGVSAAGGSVGGSPTSVSGVPPSDKEVLVELRRIENNAARDAMMWQAQANTPSIRPAAVSRVMIAASQLQILEGAKKQLKKEMR